MKKYFPHPGKYVYVVDSSFMNMLNGVLENDRKRYLSTLF
jgi:hypothetical protein